MAINFLTSVDFNDNEILGAAIQNLGTDPASGVLGQIYFNTSEDALKVCTVASTTNATWVAVGGGVETIGKATGTNPITLTGTTDVLIGITQAGLLGNGFLSASDWNTFNNKTNNTGTVTSVGLSIDVNDALDISGTNPITGFGTIDLEWQGDAAQVVLGSGELGDYKSGTVTEIELAIDNSTALAVAGDNPITSQGTIDLEWQGTSSEYVTADGGKVSIPSSDNYDYWQLSDGTTKTNIDSTDTAKFSGTANEITTSQSSGTLTIGLPDDVTIGQDLTVTKSATVDSLIITNKGTSAATAGSDSATTLATKGYVDSLTSGQLVYAGGYDASQDPPTGASVLQGYTYVVTTAGSGAGGTYWSTPLAIGDLIIALQDNPTAEANWTEVNKNVTEATLTTIGEGNVNSGAAITVSYSNGTATVGVDYAASGGLIDEADSGSGTPDVDDEILVATSSSGTGKTFKYALSDLPFSDNSGTVTSVTAGTGMTQSGVSTVNPTLNVIGGDGITATADDIEVDSTVVRTSGNQSISGLKVFSDDVRIAGTTKDLIIENDAETQAGIVFTDTQAGGGQAAAIKFDCSTETLDFFVNDEVAERMSIDTSGTLIINSGQISLSGTGRIQGVDTVTAGTDAASKDYVDTAISSSSNGERYSLGATSGAVTANGTVGGTTSWTINTVTDLGKSDPRDVTCEVIANNNGVTVFTDVSRSTTNSTLTISFNGTIANGAYEAILIAI